MRKTTTSQTLSFHLNNLRVVIAAETQLPRTESQIETKDAAECK